MEFFGRSVLWSSVILEICKRDSRFLESLCTANYDSNFDHLIEVCNCYFDSRCNAIVSHFNRLNSVLLGLKRRRLLNCKNENKIVTQNWVHTYESHMLIACCVCKLRTRHIHGHALVNIIYIYIYCAWNFFKQNKKKSSWYWKKIVLRSHNILPPYFIVVIFCWFLFGQTNMKNVDLIQFNVMTNHHVHMFTGSIPYLYMCVFFLSTWCVCVLVVDLNIFFLFQFVFACVCVFRMYTMK